MNAFETASRAKVTHYGSIDPIDLTSKDMKWLVLRQNHRNRCGKFWNQTKGRDRTGMAL